MNYLTRFTAGMLIVLTATAAQAPAQEILEFDQTLTVSDLGEATFVIDMNFNAKQFQMWQQRYGMNPSLLRREMSKSMSQYDITDFQLEKNEMERNIKLTITASGVTSNKPGGLVELEVPKEWRLVDQDDTELKFNYLEPLDNGVSIQHHITANLPAEATDVSDPVPAEGGVNRIKYQMPVAGQSSMKLVLGGILAALGAVVALTGLVTGRS